MVCLSSNVNYQSYKTEVNRGELIWDLQKRKKNKTIGFVLPL